MMKETRISKVAINKDISERINGNFALGIDLNASLNQNENMYLSSIDY